MINILDLLQDIRPDSDFRASSDFIEDYLLDSFDIMALTSDLEKSFNIQIKTDDIVPENYASIDAISNLVRKCGGSV